ncbi:peroxidase [candidate division KSB1 bacterium]|nr:peroxidase [candidate division KSB1 bacterium]NIR70943.1 peroxidase [candidate division KSB1 bacterium]NIS23247.1 peroxidase [candidate division KSB1 bacterium]NIT70129.1 peroxidase [candidate division KSB1 bacterium]NIU27863.1 peroxidase [candidate division KSB1 bacterium]
MEAHAEDLRTETHDNELVEAIKNDFRQANLDPATRRMLEFSETVTFEAHTIDQKDVESLRQNGFEDEDILDIVHIVGYFNHINRLADALGVDLEDFMIQGRGNPTTN